MAGETEELLLIYDGDCPVCRYYCEGLRADAEAGKLELVDFRQDNRWKDNAGLTSVCDPDRAIVFKCGEQVYRGGEALHQLNKVSTHRGRFNWFFTLVFCRSGISRAIYPALRFVRDGWLKIIKIKNKFLES